MIIIVGLGNPGEKFNHTPHNAGFEALDFFATKNEFPKFEFSKKYDALVCETENVLLVKPQMFMNESGKSVAAILKNMQGIFPSLARGRKMNSSSPRSLGNKKGAVLVVVHDDIDLPIGKIKISVGSGAGGHKGVASIIEHLGTKDFARIKIGICPLTGKPEGVESFVIKKFTQEEQEALEPVISKNAEALNVFINEGVEKAMNECNR